MTRLDWTMHWEGLLMTSLDWTMHREVAHDLSRLNHNYSKVQISPILLAQLMYPQPRNCLLLLLSLLLLLLLLLVLVLFVASMPLSAPVQSVFKLHVSAAYYLCLWYRIFLEVTARAFGSRNACMPSQSRAIGLCNWYGVCFVGSRDRTLSMCMRSNSTCWVHV
jgi:hypothetical protein